MIAEGDEPAGHNRENSKKRGERKEGAEGRANLPRGGCGGDDKRAHQHGAQKLQSQEKHEGEEQKIHKVGYADIDARGGRKFRRKNTED